ncbi:MAG TPA: type 4a pilus biogenesis protein PilO [Candidatus Omnitrophota bacterium]|nr:type 4a pilus biogenesis protein PilO [Candidatus Omnitrophota bacterium]
MNIRIDKKFKLLAAVAVLVVAVSYLFMGPLVGKVRRLGSDVRALDDEMKAARQALQSEKKFQQTGELLMRRQISLAINEITQTGAAQKINFLSINPQPIARPKGAKYPLLPIRMDLQSEYRDLGSFLGSLEKLQQSIVAIRSFEIYAAPDILPKIETNLVVEVYLREGEDG